MLPGPHYETAAEGAMLETLGADAVGMSTVLEVIAARELAMEVLALSMVTVTATGVHRRLPAASTPAPSSKWLQNRQQH